MPRFHLLLLVCWLSGLVGLACGPQPPETMLAGYWAALLFEQDAVAAQEQVQYPAGITAPTAGRWSFDAEQPLVEGFDALALKRGATDSRARRRLWSTLRRDTWLTIAREHTTRTTATVRLRLESAFMTEAGLDAPRIIELNYILLRGKDQVWRVNRVEEADWQRGGEVAAPGANAENNP